MIIAASQEGQLCNRLFHFSHLISYAIRSGNKLWYPFFSDYSHYFPNLNKKNLDDLQISIYSNELIRVLLPRLASLFSKFYSTLPFFRYIKSEAEIIDLSLIHQGSFGSSHLILDGWLFRDQYHFFECAPLLRELFQFSKSVNNEALKLISNIKTSYDICVTGVHIRRGDYAQWQGGCYYYDDETYLSFINQISSLFGKQGKRVNFIIFCNESISSTSPLLKPTNTTFIQNSAINDLCLMSKCDFLIGPPSSFSSWASFMGGVPLLHIDSLREKITLEKFKVCAG